MNEDLKIILNDCSIDVTAIQPVSGGDINQTYQVKTNTTNYFLKINYANRYPDMLSLEAESLSILKNSFTYAVPDVVKVGTFKSYQYLILNWIEKSSPSKSFWTDFGTALAKMHKKSQPYFGWEKENYIGSLCQLNFKRDNWASFYKECRLLPLIKILFDKRLIGINELEAFEKFCNEIVNIFPEEHPSLLHGDLWSGNFMIDKNGNPCIYDPAIYFGHREMDLAMTKLFGGFDDEFYIAYANEYPLEKKWEQRIEAAQLYPILVHAILFGGGYVNQANAIINKYS